MGRWKIVDATPDEFIEFARCFYFKPTTITAINARKLTYLTQFDHLTNCTLETLKSILRIDFDGRDEVRAFEKCILWAKGSCEQKKLDPTLRENIENQLGDCLELIQFERMTISQFQQCRCDYSHMFTADEIENIIPKLKKQWEQRIAVIVPPVMRVQLINNEFKKPRYTLYDRDTADVFFTFGFGEEQKRITTFYLLIKPKWWKLLINLSNENIDKVLILVKKYYINCRLPLDRIENELMQDDENLFSLFELSRKHSMDFLHHLCIAEIKGSRTIGMFSSEAFLNLCQESFKLVFSLILNAWDALTVFDAAIKWAEAFCARNNLLKSGENIRMALGDIVPMITFTNLKPAEFIRYRRNYRDIFSSEEILMIVDTMVNEYETESEDKSEDKSETENENDVDMDGSAVGS